MPSTGRLCALSKSHFFCVFFSLFTLCFWGCFCPLFEVEVVERDGAAVAVLLGQYDPFGDLRGGVERNLYRLKELPEVALLGNKEIGSAAFRRIRAAFRRIHAVLLSTRVVLLGIYGGQLGDGEGGVVAEVVAGDGAYDELKELLHLRRGGSTAQLPLIGGRSQVLPA